MSVSSNTPYCEGRYERSRFRPLHSAEMQIIEITNSKPGVVTRITISEAVALDVQLK